MEMQKLFKDYQKTQKYQLLKKKTKSFYKYGAHYICTYIKKPVEDIERSDIVNMRDKLGVDHGPGAANRSIATISMLLNYAVDTGVISSNPSAGIKKLKTGVINPMTPDQIDLASRELTGKVRRAFFLCLYTGQRIGDVLRMRYADCNHDFIRVVQEKTGQTVTVPICAVLRREVASWGIHTAETYLVSQKPRSLRYSAMSYAWKGEMIRIGLTSPITGMGPTMHGLRKNAAAMLAEAGCTDREIMSITGHKTNAMVGFYTGSVEKDKMARSAMDKLDKHMV